MVMGRGVSLSLKTSTAYIKFSNNVLAFYATDSILKLLLKFICSFIMETLGILAFHKGRLGESFFSGCVPAVHETM